jgi:non-heme chloroperoxidase
MDLVAAPDGVRLATYEWGNPAGPEVVLIHGFAQAHLCFAPQFESELARDFRIVAYDHRGHGASDKPADPKDYQSGEVFAKDLAAVLEARRLKRPVLVGWSMGGRITRQYLLSFGDLRLAGINFVSSLVVEDATCRGPDGPKLPPPDQTLAQEIEANTAFLDGCFAIKPAEAAFRLALAYNMVVRADVRRAILGWPSNPAATIAGLNKVRVPTLVTHGRRDTVVLPCAAERTADAIKGARISWFDQSGHSPFAEEPQRFNRELAQFVKSCQ